nr:nuclear receptor coactivator 7 isoform X1 [Misgurnus anguillicaudatus]
MMEKSDKRPGYFARLKKKRLMKQSQLEKAEAEQNQSDSKTPVICEPALIGQSKEKNPEEPGKPERCQSEDVNSKSCNQNKKEKNKPPGTVEYTVGPKDTLNSIALKFNITPNKLVHLNRLYSHSLVPGQKLFVPDVDQAERGSQVNGSSKQINTDSSEKQDGESSCRCGLPVRRETSPLSEDESLATVKFIKMSCKYFTDGMGVVGGVMIVTPNNIMFDPHKSDPLVIENGCEEYGLICPMEEVLSVALYDDVSRMKLKDALPSDEPRDLCPLYRPGEWEELPSEQDLNPFSRYEALGAPNRPIILDDIETAVSEILDKSPSDEGFTELELLQSDSITTCPSQEGASFHDDCEPKETTNRSDQKDESLRCCNVEDEGLNRSTEDSGVLLQSLPDSVREPPTQLHDVTTKRDETLVNGVTTKDATTQDQNKMVSCSDVTDDSVTCSQPVDDAEVRQKENKGPNSDAEISEAEQRRQANQAEMKSWLLKRMQGPIEDMLLCHEEKSKTPPMFLCFKVGKPMRKSFTIGLTSSPTHNFVGRGRQPEYWFAVPQERVDQLYSFFIQWSPDAYGKEAQEQGFVVVEKDELNMIDNFFSDPVPRSWEIITINEAKRRQSFIFEDEEPLDLLPVLMDPSVLLEDTHIEKLATRLPARVQGYPWRLAYSTEVHGTSLKTMYRNLLEIDSPVLLVIRDMDNQIFGAFSTHPFRVSEHYYGTGETFLYTFCPEIKVFRWSGENSYFVKGNLDSLQIGGGGGRLGLWLDADLYHGTTSRCSTFHNLLLSSKQDFIVQNLEVWAFE